MPDDTITYTAIHFVTKEKLPHCRECPIRLGFSIVYDVFWYSTARKLYLYLQFKKKWLLRLCNSDCASCWGYKSENTDAADRIFLWKTAGVKAPQQKTSKFISVDNMALSAITASPLCDPLPHCCSPASCLSPSQQPLQPFHSMQAAANTKCWSHEPTLLDTFLESEWWGG